MTDALDALYDAAIVRRAREARAVRVPEGATHRAKVHNALCGDRVEVGAVLSEAGITELGFRARGCALSLAAAHLLRELLAGRDVEEARALTRAFRAALEEGVPPEDPALAEALAPFLPVRRFPSRVRCATLACEATEEALEP